MTAFISKITSLFSAITLFFTYIFGAAALPEATNGRQAVSDTHLAAADALYAGQGMCFDGECFYSSGSVTALNSTVLAKWNKDLRRVKSNPHAVPREFYKQYGSNHIGGIDCANGYIYAPVEGRTENGYEHNFVLLYDCETLEYTGIYYELTCERLTDGIPWCAADTENGRFYTSKYNGAEEILVYDLDTMEYRGSLALSEPLSKLQGGAVYDGCIYLSSDTGDSVNEKVYRVDLATGEVCVDFERVMRSPDNEAEDIFIYPFDDGSLIHLVDYDKLLGINITNFR